MKFFGFIENWEKQKKFHFLTIEEKVILTKKRYVILINYFLVYNKIKTGKCLIGSQMELRTPSWSNEKSNFTFEYRDELYSLALNVEIGS